MGEPTVHVVDDDADVREALSFMLEALGRPYRLYRSAEEFLAAGVADGDGCALVDVRMPGLGGLELAKRLADGGSALPVILISGHGDESLAAEATTARVFGFIRKPFRIATLRAALDSALDRGIADPG